MNAPRSRSTWIKWLLLVLLVIALGLGLLRALDKRKTRAETARTAAEALKTTPVYALSARDVVTAQAIDLTQTVGISGSVEALQTAAIKARTAGEIQGLTKREGDTVKAGEVVQWAGWEVAFVAAETELQARDAARAIKAASSSASCGLMRRRILRLPNSLRKLARRSSSSGT